MIKYLNEAYQEGCPDWVKKLISRRVFTHKGRRIWDIKDSLRDTSVDLSRVTFHTDFDKSYLKDPTKICFFKIECIHLAYYRDETETAYLVKGGDGTVYYDGEVYRKDYDWGKQKLSKKSQKWLLEHMVDFCWIDMYETDSDELRSQRASASSQGGDWKRGKGQYKLSNTTKTQDEFGDDVYTTTTSWHQTRGEDKSGYPIDPQKYTKKLYSIGLTDYAEKLEDIYNKTLEVQAEANKVQAISPDTLNIADKRQLNSKMTMLLNYNREVWEAADRVVRTYNNVIRELASRITTADAFATWAHSSTRIDLRSFYSDYKAFKIRKERALKNLEELNQ